MDDIVGADRAAHTDKRTDSARSSVEYEEDLDKQDEHTVSSSRKGLQLVGMDNPYSLDLGIGGDDADMGNVVDSELPNV